MRSLEIEPERLAFAARSRRARSPRSPRSCGRRARAWRRRARRCGDSASRSARRGGSPARSSRSSRCGLSAQTDDEGAAVERLMPAQQWMTIGAARSQPRTKSTRLFDMLVVRRHVAVERLGDVVHAQEEMIVAPTRRRPLHLVVDAEQGDDMARAGLRDRVVQPRRASRRGSSSPSMFRIMIAIGGLHAWRSRRPARIRSDGLRRNAWQIARDSAVRPSRPATASDSRARPRPAAPGRAPKNRRASAAEKPASCVASRKAAPRSAALISLTTSAGSSGGRPKRRWIAASSRFSTRLVGVADHRLERRDHVADHVFRRVVQQQREREPAIGLAAAAARRSPRPAACAAPPRRYARRRSGRSSARRARARARCPRSRCRAARDRADRAAGPTACAARRAAARRCAAIGRAWPVRASRLSAAWPARPARHADGSSPDDR